MGYKYVVSKLRSKNKNFLFSKRLPDYPTPVNNTVGAYLQNLTSENQGNSIAFCGGSSDNMYRKKCYAFNGVEWDSDAIEDLPKAFPGDMEGLQVPYGDQWWIQRDNYELAWTFQNGNWTVNKTAIYNITFLLNNH